jgi:hypothetical protein
MKYFKCGKCSQAYKIDETLLKTSQVVVQCNHCKSKNVIRLGYSLVAVCDGKIQQFPLKEGVNTIGRLSNGNNVDVKLNDQYVSRNHCVVQLEVKEGKTFVTIEDKKSTNGTFNSKKDRLKTGLKYAFIGDSYFIIGLTRLSINLN